jgi:hypothetical protein
MHLRDLRARHDTGAKRKGLRIGIDLRNPLATMFVFSENADRKIGRRCLDFDGRRISCGLAFLEDAIKRDAAQ